MYSYFVFFFRVQQHDHCPCPSSSSLSINTVTSTASTSTSSSTSPMTSILTSPSVTESPSATAGGRVPLFLTDLYAVVGYVAGAIFFLSLFFGSEKHVNHLITPVILVLSVFHVHLLCPLLFCPRLFCLLLFCPLIPFYHILPRPHPTHFSRPRGGRSAVLSILADHKEQVIRMQLCEATARRLQAAYHL